MAKFTKLIAIIALMMVLPAQAVSVIVHSSNNATLDKGEIEKIFLGKSKSFSDGGAAVPIDLAEGVRGEFIDKVLGKSESQLKAYWSKLIFTGKGQAPKTVSSDAEMIDLISKNPNLIGYVSDGAVSDSVKVVAKF